MHIVAAVATTYTKRGKTLQYFAQFWNGAAELAMK